MVSVAKWNIIWKWNTIDYENENTWKISIIYEKLWKIKWNILM